MAVKQTKQLPNYIHHHTSDGTALSKLILRLRELFSEQEVNIEKVRQTMQNSELKQEEYSKYIRWRPKGLVILNL